jgi:aconitase A
MAQTERKKTIKIGEKDYYYFDITSFGDQTRKLPFSHKILLENLLRKQDDKIVTQAHVDNLLSRKALKGELLEIPTTLAGSSCRILLAFQRLWILR